MAKPDGNSQRITTSDGDRFYKEQKCAIRTAQKAIGDDLANMAKRAGYAFSPKQEEQIIESVELYWRTWCHETKSNSGADVRNKIGEAKRNLYALFKFVDNRVETRDSRRARVGQPGSRGRKTLEEVDEELLQWKAGKWRRKCRLLSRRKFSPARAANMLSNVTWLALVGLDKCEERMFKQNRQTLHAGKGWDLWMLLLEAIVKGSDQEFVANPRATTKRQKAIAFVGELHSKLPGELTSRVTNLPENLRSALASRREFANSKNGKVPISYEDWKKEMKRFLDPTAGRWIRPSEREKRDLDSPR